MEKHLQQECDVCFAKCDNLKALDDHMATHIDGPEQFQCDRCGKSFYLRETLKRHRQNHPKQLSVTCRICDKRCVNRKTLLRHMKLHTARDTLSCPECDEEILLQKQPEVTHATSHRGVAVCV